MRFGTLAHLGLAMSALVMAPGVALAEDPPEVVAERQKLNEQQAKFAADQIAGWQAERQAVAEKQAEADRAYKEALAAREAEIAASQQAAADARARWEAAVAACNAGDYSQCAQPQSPQK